MRLASSRLALDRRRSGWAYDRDGRLRVRESTLSKSTVNEYMGAEIPGHRALGLEPNKLYRLWRHPDELRKATPSFNGLPLLARHVPTTAADHKHADTVGTTGSTARFAEPCLRNGLVIWTVDAIQGIEDGTCRELSCAYHYTPKMGAGRTPSGEAYDGIMTAIEGNHCALVERGRVGPDAVVGDAALAHDFYALATFPHMNRLKMHG